MRLPSTSTEPTRRADNHGQRHSSTVEHTGQALRTRSSTRRPVAGLDNLPPTLSIEEAAELCGIGRNAAYRAVHRGELPSLRLGRRIRIPTARLLQMLGVGIDGTEG